MPLTKVIALPTAYASDQPTPGPDGLYRDTVIEYPTLDPSGRRQFVAVDGDGRVIEARADLHEPVVLVAHTEENIERVRRKLWDRVYAWRDRDRPSLLK